MKRRNVMVISVSLDPELILEGRRLARLSGHEFSFSAWIRALIRKEIEACHARLRTSPSALTPP